MTGGSVPGSAERFADLFWLGDSVRGWTVMILLGAIPTVSGYGFYNVSLTLLDASVANIIVSLEPLFTAVLAFMLLGETLSPVQLLGSALLLSGVAAIKLADLRRAPDDRAGTHRRPVFDEQRAPAPGLDFDGGVIKGVQAVGAIFAVQAQLAGMIGIEPERVFKTLVADVDGRLVVVVALVTV